MIHKLIFKLLFKLLKGYSIFFCHEDIAYYINDIMIDIELKEIILKSVERKRD